MIIAANWKMHKTAAEAVEFCKKLRKNEAEFNGVEVLICPPYTALAAVSEALRGSKLKLGAQNLHWEKQGAFTGEISAEMLREFGVEYVIVGHSERRHLMQESDDQINKKLKTVLRNKMKPILCVGETEDERELELTQKVITRQLCDALMGLKSTQIGRMVIAYEPVWAIGTGKAATVDDAHDAAELIKAFIKNNYSEEAHSLRIQYGGSVKADNIGSFVSLSQIEGALVGGASLEADSFNDLIQAARKAVLH